MATTIKLKNSVTTTNAPSSLVQGEVAINITDKKVWVGNAATTPIQLLGDGGSASFTSIAFGAGTVSNPSITFTGDTNTGIYSPAADTIAFTEGGAESMRIDSSGNVLVGTTTAQELLTVNKNAAFGTTADAFSEIRFFNSTATSGTTRIRADANNLLYFISNTERMRIDSSGNVGIGINSISAVGSYKVLALSGSATNGGYLSLQTSGTEQGNIYTNSGGLTLSAIGATNITVYTNGSERMRIDSSGNLGVGTSSPNTRIQSTVGSSGSGVVNALRLQNVGTTVGDGAKIVFTAGTSTDGAGIASTGVALDSADLRFYTGGSNERMRITSGGEVYIAGTTDQGAYNLQCNGTGVWGAGAYVNGSDERIKDNIAPLDSGLDVVAKLNPVTYKYKENWSKDQSTQTGFIAQELLTALDGKNYVDGVVQQGGEYMSVAYQNIIPILTKAIQEQQAMIEELKQEVAKLKGV